MGGWMKGWIGWIAYLTLHFRCLSISRNARGPGEARDPREAEEWNGGAEVELGRPEQLWTHSLPHRSEMDRRQEV